MFYEVSILSITLNILCQVKESRLLEVMGLLASAGFDPYSADPNLLTSRIVSPILSPTAQDESPSIMDIGHADISIGPGPVLTPASGIPDTPIASEAQSLPPQDEPKMEHPSVPPDEPIQPDLASPGPRSKSHSPTSGEVCALPSDLTCVGLSNDSVDHWGLKIIKLVAFPDLIPEPESEITPSRHSKSFDDINGASEPLVISTASVLNARGRRVAMKDDSASSSDEDGYFSHSPERSSSLVTSTSRSSPDLTRSSNISRSFKPSSKHVLSPFILDASTSRSDVSTTSPTADKSHRTESKVPFFSFTRTSEGSSLTTDVNLLAALFPRSERHMVICSGELDAVDDRNANPSFIDFHDDDEEGPQGNTLKCLQIDLRRFGLGEASFIVDYMAPTHNDPTVSD